MGDNAGWNGKIEENPLLSKLTRVAASDSITFWGYVGPKATEDSIILYSSLENLDECVEIPRADILHVEDVPESVLLFGAKVVWVRREAKVIRRRASVAGTLTKGSRELALTPDDEVVEVRKGRLRMQMRKQGRASDCKSPCSTCRTPCGVCISTCTYKDPIE